MKILHVFDHSIPLHSGYTFRSRAIVNTQRELGWQTAHVTSAKHAAGAVPGAAAKGDAAGANAGGAAAAPLQEFAMIERFCELVRSGRPDDHWPQFAVDVQRVCDGLSESARAQRIVELT